MQEIIKGNETGRDGQTHSLYWDSSGIREEQGTHFLEDRVGGVRFVVKRKNIGTPQMTADFIMTLNGKDYVGPDERIVIKTEKQEEEVYLPGQTYRGYYFYLSRERDYLYVDRPLVRKLAVAQIYRVEPKKLSPVHFNKLRIDEFVITEFLKHKKGGVRIATVQDTMIFFEKWVTSSSVQVSFVMTPLYSLNNRSHPWTGSCIVDLKSKRIFNLTETTETTSVPRSVLRKPV
jgi:hypothetical protein